MRSTQVLQVGLDLLASQVLQAQRVIQEQRVRQVGLDGQVGREILDLKEFKVSKDLPMDPLDRKVWLDHKGL